ncbi:YidC/Oxa1 family membrane protein insertase [Sphaerisporangium sp. NPDC049003]|uniref:YidC/Oxa1 family membrane protein insertase n=1 Tax=Sphaerisporangium sp. NPDC049003 TaxID=3364517 RepID=UPI0037209299
MFDTVIDSAYRLINGLGSLTGAAFAIVLFTLAVRLLLLPLSVRQAKAQKARLRLAPQVEALRKRFARDPERLMRETSKLYAAGGTSMFAGIMPGLAQAPFLMITYRVFVSATIAGHPNLLLAQSALGVPLGEHFAAVLAGSGLGGGAGDPVSQAGLIRRPHADWGTCAPLTLNVGTTWFQSGGSNDERCRQRGRAAGDGHAPPAGCRAQAADPP